MFRVIHPNRYFIWTLVVLLAASLILMFWIQGYLLEVEQEIYANQKYLRSGWRTFYSEALGLSVRYPSSWEIEIDSLEPKMFSLQNPEDFGENISFSQTTTELRPLIRASLDILAEENIVVDHRQGTWLKGSIDDPSTSNVVLIEISGRLYQIAGSARQFERIVKSIKFLKRF